MSRLFFLSCLPRMTAAPCRAGPMCPAEKCVPGGGAHGPRPTGRYVEPRVGDGVLQWSAVEQMPLGTASHQRGSAALSFRASAHTGVGIRLLAGADDSARPVSPPQKAHLPPSRRRKKVTGRRRSLGFTDGTAACTPRSTGQRSGTSWRGRWTGTRGYRRNRIPAR